MNTPPPASPVADLRHRLREHLEIIYPGEDTDAIAAELMEVMGLEDSCESPGRHRNLWDQTHEEAGRQA